MNLIDEARLFLASQTPIPSMLANPVVLERCRMECRKNSNTMPVCSVVEIPPSGIAVGQSQQTHPLAGAKKRNIHRALLREANCSDIAHRACIRIFTIPQSRLPLLKLLNHIWERDQGWRMDESSMFKGGGSVHSYIRPYNSLQSLYYRPSQPTCS